MDVGVNMSASTFTAGSQQHTLRSVYFVSFDHYWSFIQPVITDSHCCAPPNETCDARIHTVSLQVKEIIIIIINVSHDFNQRLPYVC